MMSTNNFDISKIIERYGLDPDKVAEVLYPLAKYPKQAFARVLNGESHLDTMQVTRLADYIGVFVPELFNLDSWASKSEDGCLIFTKGLFKAKLNYKGVYLTLYRGDEVILQNVADIPGMTVKEFIEYLDNFIKTYEK